ncbi:MAG TPA: hypothetical protein VD833_05435 [Vicinamibacterales bacterium]|nr:hypothetical protein [Vicinamibacterales bacterium]
MIEILPANPKARRTAILVWAVAAATGSAGVWWLASYLDTLTELARTDRSAALAMFRSRVLPALLLVVAVAVVAGVVLMRHGLEVVRQERFPLDGAHADTSPAAGRRARGLGWIVAVAGFLLAAFPLAMLVLVFWLLRQT